ncbi:MAG: hypothetical protein FJ010_11525 [Chloroflexi bacterium]|nr:hypothetical protein [Chloroflexota bacterium]
MSKRIFRLPYTPIILAPLILFAPMLFTGKALFWGAPALQFVPWWSWAWETILEGHLPLWNPLLGMGTPLMANYQSALFYPPTWVYFLFYALGGIGAMVWAQALMVSLHLIWAGLGIAALARKLGLGALSQAVSGLAFSLSGYLVARAWFASINVAVAWLPWVMLYAFTAVKERDRRAWWKLGVVIGLQMLAGHAQMTGYTLLLAGLWIAYWEWHRNMSFKNAGGAEFSNDLSPRSLRSPRLNNLFAVVSVILAEIRLGLAALLGFALAAVQLFPTAVYLMQSQRAAAVDMDFALNYSFWPWRFLDLLAPGLFGSPVSGDYWGYGNYWEDAIYIGIVPILLAIGALANILFRKRRDEALDDGRSSDVSRRSLTIFLAALAFISFLLALGKNTPLFPWLYQHVPTFDMFQAPTRISIWAVFALALLAGVGAERLRRPEGRGLYWTRLGTAGALAVSLGAGLTLFAMSDVSLTFIRATALAGLWGLGAGVLALTVPTEGKLERWWAWLATTWIALDLLAAGWGLTPGADMAFYTGPAASGDLGEGRLYLPLDQEDDLKYRRFFRFDAFDPGEDWGALRAALLPNINMLEGIPSANNFDPLLPGRYTQWMESLENVDMETRDGLLDLMGVTALEEVDAARGAGVRYILREGAYRLRWVACAVSARDEADAWEQVFSGKINFGSEVILEGAEPSLRSDCPSAQGQAILEDQSPNELVIHSESAASGWVVLSDVWYPGWRARLDGSPVEIRRANFLFRAVPVPPGAHIVEFEYHPVEFYLGGALSLVAWFVTFYIFRNCSAIERISPKKGCAKGAAPPSHTLFSGTSPFG